MNIEEINRKHFIETDMYYRVGYGLTSKLTGFSNGIFTVEVVMSHKWNKDYNTTAQEIAYLWKNTHDELNKSIGCKIHIIDSRNFPYKQALLQRNIVPGCDAKKGILFRKGYLN